MGTGAYIILWDNSAMNWHPDPGEKRVKSVYEPSGPSDRWISPVSVA